MGQNANPNTVVWFEVPVTNMGRATKFYETVLGMSLHKEEMEGSKMAIFPSCGDAQNVVHGALVEGEGYTPGNNGPVIYFNGGADLAVPLARVEKAGGKVILPKTPIGPHGFCAQFIDTEGNRCALHSDK